MNETRKPLEVELLVSEDARRLATALDNHPRPWPCSPEADRLADVHRFDEIDYELAVRGGNQTRDEQSVSRLNSILDEIGKDGPE